jgi:ATP-dependent Clp protease ATP-binding subunit ClpC
MMRLEPNVVLKYFEPVDGFVRIRRFNEAEVGSLLRDVRGGTRRTYIDLVLNAAVMHFAGSIAPQLASLREVDRPRAEEALYQLCVEVSPALDIRRVTIPVSDPAEPSIHLLERGAERERRDFRRLRDMESQLGRRVIGQPRAIASVSRAVRKALTGLRDPQRPIATFFFVGQTGVGKTELAKALAFYLYDDASRVCRVDCSEYALPHEVAKLTGSPPGYVGHDQAGLLAEAIGRNEDAVVLFDEIEKSDPKVHDLLLQLMDEGFITDNKARRVPFGRAIVILTSNVGAQEIDDLRRRVGFDAGRRRLAREQVFDETLASLGRRFKPEFVNRLTEVVLFDPLDLPDCVRIVTLMLEDVRRHAASVPIALRVASSVPRFLAEKGYRPEHGARELRRTVESEVEGRLSELLVEGRVREGDSVTIRVSRDRLVFSRN